MTKKTYRVPHDLKQQILDRVKQGGKTIKEIAAEHGISDKSIYSWLRTGALGMTSKEELRLRRENQELKALIGELTIQLSQEQKKGLPKRV